MTVLLNKSKCPHPSFLDKIHLVRLREYEGSHLVKKVGQCCVKIGKAAAGNMAVKFKPDVNKIQILKQIFSYHSVCKYAKHHVSLESPKVTSAACILYLKLIAMAKLQQKTFQIFVQMCWKTPAESSLEFTLFSLTCMICFCRRPKAKKEVNHGLILDL